LFFRELVTERLILRNIGHHDREFIYRQFSDLEVNRYLFDTEPLSSVEEADALIRFYLEEEPRWQHRWILTRKEDGEKMGTCGFHCWNKKSGICEIGYDLYPDYWKQGYMAEALTAIIDFGQKTMKLKKLEAHIYIGNADSIQSARRQQFVDSKQTYMETFRGIKYPHVIYVRYF